MPASIFITEDHVINFSWENFNRITMFSRPFMTNEELENDLYMSVDSGIDALFVKSLNKKDFNIFYLALNKGLNYYTDFKKGLPLDEYNTVKEWNHLLCELRSDSRFVNSK